MDADYAYGGKTWWQLHKNIASFIEKVLEATSHKAAVVQTPTTHLKKTSKLNEQDMQDTTVEVRASS